jgi:parallel beta-helix repeat protein
MGAYIQNQNAGQQASSNFWISGTGRADVSFTTPLIDTATAAALNIGTTNASQINLNKNVVIAASQSITITGGNTASRPASPTEGMLYYDTTTKQLLVYTSASGTAKWQADHSDAVLVAANDSSPAAKAAADFVATGTGDQATINSALTAATTTTGSNLGGRKVYLFAGTYTVNGTISVPNNTTLSGAGYGTLIIMANSVNTSTDIIANSDTATGTGVVIQDLRVDGNSAGQSTGLHTGVQFQGIGGGSGSTARQGGKIVNVWANNCGFAGIYLNNAPNNTLTNNAVFNSQFGILISSNSNYNTITNNLAQGNTSYGIDVITNSAYNTITGNTAQGNTIDGIAINGGTNNAITGNTVAGNSSHGIALYSTSNSNTVSGNKIYDNGGASQNSGIYINSADSNTVTGNNITDSSATGNNYAININAGSSNYLASNTLGGGTINDGGGISTQYGSQATGTTFNIMPRSTVTIQSTGTTSISTATATTSGAITIQSGASTSGTAGSVTVDTGTSTSGTSNVAIGNINAGSISLGHANITTTVTGNETITNATATAGNLLNITQNTTAFTGTGILVNLANGSGSFASGKYIDLQTNGTSKFAVDATGKVTLIGGQAADITTGGATTLQIDTGGAAGITIGGTNATSVNVGSNATTTMNLGQSTVTNTINIGNATISTGNTQTITIGTSATGTGKDVVTIGSLNDASNTTLQAGSGGTLVQVASSTSNAFIVQNTTQSLSSTGQFMTFGATTSATNLITNPSFENTPMGATWSAKGSSTITKHLGTLNGQTTSYNGTSDGKVVTTAAANDGIKQNVSLAISTYTVSFYAKLDAASAAMNSDMVFGFFNGTDETTYASSAQTVVSTGWTRYSATFNVASVSGTPYFYVKQTDAAVHTFYIDQVQVESGSNASGQGVGTLQLNSVVVSPLILQNTVNSTSAFAVYDSSGSIVFGIDTMNRRVVFGSGVTSVHSKYITLTPEYTGAVLDAAGDASCSGANNGTMTSGFDSGGTKQNYYQWVSGAAATNCYDVVVSVPIPADFLSWGAGPTIYGANSASLANSICLQILNTTGAADSAYASYSCQTPGSSIAALTTFATPTSSYSAGSSNTITLKIRMTSNTTTSLTKLGNISIPYTSSY